MQSTLGFDDELMGPGRVPGPELVVGMIAPLGIDGSVLDADLRAALARWNYFATVIRLSKLLSPVDPPHEYPDERIERLIRAGDDLCRRVKDAAAVGSLAIATIKQRRGSIAEGLGLDPADDPLPRTAYIVHSLKRPAEVHLLRKVYGERFFLIARHAPFERRRNALVQRWGIKPGTTLDDLSRRAKELMDMDAKEEDEHGQGVDAAFPMADYYLGEHEPADRAIDLLFGDHRRAPTKGEHAMFAAYATSSLSLEGSRRVGSALMDGAGSVIAVGANQVPPGELSDAELQYDWSGHEKQEVLADTLRILGDADWLSPEKAAIVKPQVEGPTDGSSSDVPQLSGRTDFDRLVMTAMTVFEEKKSRLLDLIEFQRPVHAEMSAITDAARRGIPIQGATLYTTTYPCHLCAKNVFASGIAQVYYIAPYPKSRATAMYAASAGAVQPFNGTGPQAYRRLFLDRELPVADKMGQIAPPDMLKAIPRITATTDAVADLSYLERETEVSSKVEGLMVAPAVTEPSTVVPEQPSETEQEAVQEGESLADSSRPSTEEDAAGEDELPIEAQERAEFRILCDQANKTLDDDKMTYEEFREMERRLLGRDRKAARPQKAGTSAGGKSQSVGLQVRDIILELQRIRRA